MLRRVPRGDLRRAAPEARVGGELRTHVTVRRVGKCLCSAREPIQGKGLRREVAVELRDGLLHVIGTAVDRSLAAIAPDQQRHGCLSARAEHLGGAIRQRVAVDVRFGPQCASTTVGRRGLQHVNRRQRAHEGDRARCRRAHRRRQLHAGLFSLRERRRDASADDDAAALRDRLVEHASGEGRRHEQPDVVRTRRLPEDRSRCLGRRRSG